MTATPPPAQLVVMLGELAESTDRLLETVDAMTDREVRAPSLLPGWTRGHVLTHLARNADGLCVLAENAKTGGDAPMYPGEPGARDEAIEAGAGRGLGDLRLDLTDSAERLLETFVDFTDEAAGRVVRLRSGATAYGRDIPLLRIREVEIHHVDLGLEYRPDSWPSVFVHGTLDQLAASRREARDWPVRELVAPDGRWQVSSTGPVLRGPSSELLAWLTGRHYRSVVTSDGSPVPQPRPWG